VNATELTPELTALVNTARVLPPELVRQVADFAEFLRAKRAALPIDESDEWSEEDLRDWRLHSLRYFESMHPNEDWGTDYGNPGEPE